MSQWVRTDFTYDPRMAILCVSSRQAVMMSKLDLRSLAEDQKSEEVEKIVLDVIEELRPDLSGCTLYAIAYKLHPMQWEFTVFHRSLPPVPCGEMPRRQDLVTGEMFPV